MGRGERGRGGCADYQGVGEREWRSLAVTRPHHLLSTHNGTHQLHQHTLLQLWATAVPLIQGYEARVGNCCNLAPSAIQDSRIVPRSHGHADQRTERPSTLSLQ
jgi:hypothetical protein